VIHTPKYNQKLIILLAINPIIVQNQPMLNFQFISQTIAWLENLATQISPPYFVFIGSLAEEIISPIPSPLVLTLAGSISATQDKPHLYLIILALVGSLAKTLASWIFYVFADKIEDIFSGRWAKFLGINKHQIEKIGTSLNQYKQKTLILTLIRAFPASPSLPISLVCGFIKIDLKSYLFSTYIGYTLRNIFYLYVGYLGITSITSQLDSLQSIIKLGFVIISIAIIIYLYYLRSQGKTFTSLFKSTSQNNSND